MTGTNAGRIVTHDDFDGIASAAIAGHVLKIDRFAFAGPRTIAESRISVSGTDVVCDLPCPSECGMWFDHHEGNLEDLKYRGIDPASIPGAFAAKPSCARVVFDFFSSGGSLPDRFNLLADEADVIDSFAYAGIEEWRRETPAKMIEACLKLDQDRRERDPFMASLVRNLRDRPLGEVAGDAGIRAMALRYRAEEESMLEQAGRDASFLPEDAGREVILLDLTRHNRNPRIVKNLAYLLFPKALAVLEIRNRFERGVKTNDLHVSMSLSLNLNGVEHGRDIGEIMRSLNIGDGHRGAGAGAVACKSKPDMLKRKDKLIRDIFDLWRKQTHA